MLADAQKFEAIADVLQIIPIIRAVPPNGDRGEAGRVCLPRRRPLLQHQCGCFEYPGLAKGIQLQGSFGEYAAGVHRPECEWGGGHYGYGEYE